MSVEGADQQSEKLFHYLKEGCRRADETRARLREYEQRATEIGGGGGIGCRFPAAWMARTDPGCRFLAGRTVLSPTDRWDVEAIRLGSRTLRAKPTRDGAFQRRHRLWTAGFFGTAPAKCWRADPQRVDGVSWEAVGARGLDPLSLRGSATGVYTGIFAASYGNRDTGGQGRLTGHVNRRGLDVVVMAGAAGPGGVSGYRLFVARRSIKDVAAKLRE